MDVAYNQHSPYSRHHSRSHTNLSHLTLAPLTSRLPLSDADALPLPSSSYIEGRSAPTTPSILSRSSSRVSLKKPMSIALPKSKSSTHLVARKQPRGATTPGGTRLKNELNLSPYSEKYRSDSDWLLRAGAAISSSTRESKGQSWLVSRASSTSLTGQRDDDEEEMERELAREREQICRRESRRGSAVTFDADDEFSPVTIRGSLNLGPRTGTESRPHSRFGSRVNSRRGSKVQVLPPLGGERDGYFDQGGLVRQDLFSEPDFVDAEEEIYENEDEGKHDDAEVRKLARSSSQGLSGWVEKMLGWSLFAVDDDGEDEAQAMDEKAEDSEISPWTSSRDRDGIIDPMAEEVLPSLRDGPDGEVGGWQDAAWLLSVATKVLL
ncbi:hypothetical protein BUE80_DR003908 [Diplocarpon rosae]|nr:hypothetical protein BUE80_DR003908 [Diplocarpon rosae]